MSLEKSFKLVLIWSTNPRVLLARSWTGTALPRWLCHRAFCLYPHYVRLPLLILRPARICQTNSPWPLTSLHLLCSHLLCTQINSIIALQLVRLLAKLAPRQSMQVKVSLSLRTDAYWCCYAVEIWGWWFWIDALANLCTEKEMSDVLSFLFTSFNYHTRRFSMFVKLIQFFSILKY